MIKTRILSITMVFLSLFSVAQKTADSISQSAFSLEQAKEFAVKHNATVKNAVLDIESAKKKIWETTAIGLPQINGEIAYQHVFNPPLLNFGGMSFPLTEENNVTYTLTATQLVFSGEYLVGLQASKTYLELSTKSQTKTEIELKEAIAKAYYLVLVAEENLKILKESYNLTSQTLKDLEGLNQQGFNEETDVDQMKMTKSSLENTINAITRQVAVAYNLLKFQMGIDLSQSIQLTETLDQFIGNAKTLPSTDKYDVNTNIDYQLILTKEKLSTLSLKREKSKYLPSIAAFYQHTELGKKPVFNTSLPNIVGVSVKIPLFTSGQQASRVAQAKIALEQDQNTKEMVANSLLLDYEQSKAEYLSAYEKYQTSINNVALSKKIYDRTYIKYKEGISSNFDLTQAQTQFLNNQSGYIASLLDLLNTKAKLDRLNTTN